LHNLQKYIPMMTPVKAENVHLIRSSLILVYYNISHH
jgi:hypothetical protein